MDDNTDEVPNKVRTVDDTLLFEPSIEDCFLATCKYMDLFARNGVVLNPDRFKFGRREFDFAGFNVTDEGVRPTKKMLEAITSFPIRLVNQVAYSFCMTEEMAPFRDLL